MASDFLTKPLNEMFGGKRSTPDATTRLVAMFEAGEFPVEKRGKLWTVDGPVGTFKNSVLGDLIDQIERHGGIVERRKSA